VSKAHETKQICSQQDNRWDWRK